MFSFEAKGRTVDFTERGGLFILEGWSTPAVNQFHSLKLTASSHLKMDAWKTIVFFWGPAYFPGRTVSFEDGMVNSKLLSTFSLTNRPKKGGVIWRVRSIPYPNQNDIKNIGWTLGRKNLTSGAKPPRIFCRKTPWSGRMAGGSGHRDFAGFSHTPHTHTLTLWLPQWSLSVGILLFGFGEASQRLEWWRYHRNTKIGNYRLGISQPH